jgi:DNA-binding NarL/FixJ family response regulator
LPGGDRSVFLAHFYKESGWAELEDAIQTREPSLAPLSAPSGSGGGQKKVGELSRRVVQSSILIVDDHPLFVEALKLVIQNTVPDATVSEAASIEAARAMVDKRGPFDLVLLDLSMPGTRGLDGLIELRSRYPRLPLVVVSALEDPRIIHEVMTCGAAGFISKSTRGVDLGNAIREVMAGSVVLPKNYQPPQDQDGGTADLTARLATLTPQQVRVLQMLRQGLLNKQIAYDLGVGETTVKAHVSEILRKLKVTSRTQAVIEAAKIDFDSILSQSGDDPDAS